MKARVVVIFVSCLVAGGVLALDSTEWQDGEWTTEPEYNISAIEPFSKPGYILPDLSISDIISTVGTMYQAEDLVHAIGSFCMEMRQLNWLTSGAMEELCLPILEALRNDSYAEAYSICRSSWSFVAELFGNEEDEYRDEGYPEGEYGMEGEDEVDHVPIRRKRWGFSIPQIELPPLPDIQNITLPLSPIQDILNITIPFSPIHDILNITVPFSPVDDLDLNWTNPIYDDTANVIGNIGLIPQFNRNWSFPLFDGTDFPFFNFPDQYEICSSLAGLITHDMPTYPDLDHGNIFGVVLKVIVAEHLKSIPGKCTSFLDDYEGSGDTGGDPLFDTDTDAMIDAFATLGGFDDIEQICNVSGWALIMTDQGNFELFNELVNQTTASIYSVITNRSRCIDFADSLHATFDLGRGNFSHITSSDAFCDELFHYPFWRGNMSEIDFYLYENMDEKDGFIHLLFFIEMLSHKSDLGALEFLCRMSPYTDERFCTALAYNEYRDVSREEIIERCLRYTSFNSFEFDFLALVNAFGVEFGFDFYDFGQTCSHLTDIIFNDEIKQRFTIRNVIQMGMKAFGRVLAPMFCDLPSFRNGSLDSLEAPCEIPGRGCFNWTIPGNDFFLDRLDVGFITGTIFSFLGGYRDGDHVCHQMAFALENDTLLDMVAGRLEESIYRLFDNATFCSNTIDLITKLMGIDADIAPLIGFISTDSFCLEMSEIFHQERNYNFSFDSFLNLFVNEVDGGAHFVTSESIMYATAEMMKFAAMVIHSDTIGDAIYTSCLMWQGSGPFFLKHIFEVDEFCQAALALDPGKLEHVCIYDLIPWLKYGLDHHDDEKEEEIDFDFGGLFETVGEEFGFDFSDSDQSCSHLNDILFNETVAQSYSIDSIVVKGIRIIGKTVSPIFCEFENLPETELEDPCMIPGQSCFNWSSRGEDYFHDREDIGFIIGTIFSYLGGYRDGDHLCHQMEFALHDDSQLDMVANKMKESVFRFFSDQSFCSGTMGIISNLIGQDVDAATILGFENADSFCGNVNQIYNDNGDLPVNLEPLYVLFDSMNEYGEVDSHAIANATIEIIKFATMLLHSEDMGDALSRTCHVWQASAAMFNVSEIDDLCQMVIESNADALYEVCTDELYPFIHWLEYGSDRPDEEKEEEIDFDFGGLLETVGEEFGFDFFDYDQSCSHLTDILFDEIVAQSYSIDSVVVKGIRIIGKTVSPIFCEYEHFPETELEDPCITPGQNCFNWSSRGEDFFHDREDIGFIIGTIFSYLGGYRDGDHLCHQMEFALHDDSQLDMVANKMKDSVFRFVSDQSFCSGTMGIISNLIGQDMDAASILGFENADSFCGNVNQIYNDNGDLPVNLEPLYVLFDSMDAEGEVDSHSIANATIEIIKFAAMLLHSEDMGDALSRTCHVWQASSAMFNVSEIDDVCQMVIESNADALYEVCTDELYPNFIELFIEGGPHDVDPNRTAPIVDLVDLSNVEICLENGEVTFEGLEDLDILAYLMQITSKLYNVTEIDEDSICKGITNVIQSRKDIPTLITEFVVEWMTVFMPLGAELCSCWDQAFGYIFQETGDSGFGVDQLNEIVLIAVDSIGLASHHELCNDLIHLKPGNMTEYAEMIMEEILDFTANPEKCSCTVNRVIDFILPLVNVTMEEFHNYTYQFLGFESVEHVCSFVAESFSGVIVDPSEITCNDQQAPTTQRTTQPTFTTQASTKTSNDTVSEEEECFFIRDCAGVCNGDARYDCAGECGGTAELDCAFTCGGSATINGCGWCVGGESGRPNDFGYECGSCKGESTATTVDCNNDCNGTAYRDACQVCVGGNTGVDEDISASSLNCLGLCDDRYILNDCDECVPNTLGTIFSTKDCNHECKGLAIINECGYCVGGSTNRPADTGLTECGVCNTTSDPEFCFGCDGVAYSEATTDACDVCGGDGSTCFTVDSIAPSLIPADTDYQVKLRGAGFQDATTKQCKFLDSNSEQVNAVDITNEVGDEFNCTANLPAGTYSVYLSTESTELSEESVNLYVYPEITVNSISQSEFDIDDSETSISVNMVSTSGAFTAYKTLTTPKAIIYTETERIVIDGTFGGDNDDLLEFSGPMLTTSTQVTVYPSFNGIDSLATPDNAGFTITYYAPAPVVESLKFSSTGHLLELEFDVAINEEAVTSCDAIFMNTTTLGGEDAQCYAFPFLRVIYILPSSLDGGSLIEPDDELILRENVLKKRDEEYARYVSGTLTASSPDEAVSVIADLQGTEVISCGNVRLSALRSRGSAGRSFTYQWSVSSDGSIPTELTDELTAAENYAFVSLAGSYLDPNTEYTFTITVENFLGGSDTDSLVVTRSDLNRPDVVIYPERVDISSALISQYFFLRASVRFSEACGGAEQMVYSWSVDDDSIALNLLTMSKPLLYVGAGTLPGNTDVTFTLEVSRESDPSTVTTQSVTVTTVYSDLVALIAGGSERTIGVDSGNFTLDGSSSSDPDNQNEEMAYLWTCEELNSDTGSYDPCVSSDTRELFPTEGESTASTLSLASNNLYSDSTYRFTLEITKLSRTASTSVTVIAKAGNPPQITVPEPLPDKIKSSSSHTLRVYITHTSDITIEWATVDTDLGYGYVDFSQLSSQELLLQGETSPFLTTAYVAIPTETLEAGYTYSFSVTVTDAEGQVSTSKIATTTYGGVSSCTLGIVDGSTSYQELDEITLVTQNCVTDAEAYPLTYQILHERAESSGTRYNALTGALAEASITIVGLTAFSNDQNTFAVKVCNDVGICSLYALTLDVTAIESFTQEQFEESIANLVDPQKLSGNFLDALVTFNTIASVGVSESRKRRAVADTSATATEQLDLLQSAISSTVLDTASAQTLLDQSDSVVVAELTLADMDVYLDILIELVDVFSDEELPESSAETVLEKSSQIASELDPQYNSDMFAKITTLRNTLVQGQLSQIPLGGEPTETRAGSQTTRAFYAIPSETLSTTSDNTSFSVKFGSEIENLYASWTCASGGTCSGVQIRFTQYDDDVDHYSTSAEDMANRASSILEIDLLDPSDSSELDITGLTSPISINMTATILQDGKVYDCYYWDSSNSSWSQDGLTTVYHSTVLSECQTTHLSAFTLISVDAPTTVPMPTTVDDDGNSSTDSGATTTTEVSESGGRGGLSTTGIIVIAVVIPVVLILIIVIAIVVIMSKKSSKIGSADVENTNSNGAGMGTSTAGGLVPVESANQAFSTPSHNPQTAPPAKPSHTVEVAAVPEPVAQDPIMDATSLPGSPEPPPEGPHIDTIIRDAQEGGGAQTPVDRAMTPVE